MRVCLLLVLMVVMVSCVECGRILFLNPISSKSHKNFYMGIVNPLAQHGHQVTMVSPYKPSKERQNIREIVLPDMDLSNFIPNLFASKMTGPLKLVQEAPRMCSDALAKKEMESLLKEEFDLILLSTFFSDCFLSVVHKLKIPFIIVLPAGIMPPFNNYIGNPSFPSYTPSKLMNFKHPMTFTERAFTTITETLLSAMFHYYLTPSIENECRSRGLCPQDMPDIPSIRKNNSLLFINNVQSLDEPARPYVPGVIHLGGIHCHPPQPLPKDLDEWVNGAGSDGFIFFSLGSAVTPSSMPEKHRQTLVKVFGSLKQRVLWKWDKDTMDDLPPNVRLGKWLPQQDILGDPRLQLFITHGGLHSTQESIYHGVPILGMPVFADQESNMMQVQSDGWGSILFWDDLTHETMIHKIQFVMNNKELKTRVTERSAFMQDQPQELNDVVVYWTEYVMRHKGARHLRSPEFDLPWYKLYNVDVWASVLVVIIGFDWILYRLICACCRCIFSSSTKRKRD